MKPSPVFITVARAAAIVLLIVHIYNLIAKDQVPKWSYLLFAVAMFLIVFLNLYNYRNAKRNKS